MNNYRDIITIEPGKRSGQPCIRGMRITVYDVFEYLASGMTVAEVLHDFPELTETDIRACFAYAAAKEKSEKNDIDKRISKQYNLTWNCSEEYRTEIATHEHTH
ncbi:hypothetical protein C6496_04660 [Candidatus Poribacteria bacterium]|nr:MAG: hypothetical protein C6496_04660 [Candidatus Poribacteria bacterium]